MSEVAARRWQEICRLFDELCDLNPAARQKRLDEIASAELRRAVEGLLAGDEIADERLARLDFAVFDVLQRNSHAPSSQVVDPLNLIGRSISHFRVIDVIAAGGMGVVYRAEDTRLERPVALKLPLHAQQLDRHDRERFLREARAAGSLDHPNLCSVYEVGESEDGRPFLAMALYDGESLKTRLARTGALPLEEALNVARQVALGLARAHAAGVVHRDLKPGNIMLLPDGTAKLLDFGLAKLADFSNTASGAALGTAGYMAPEQIRGQTVDARTDLWALGVVLYEMLTAQRPFAGSDPVSMAHAILHDDAPRTTSVRSGLPATVDDLVQGLLQKDPARRYASAGDVIASIEDIQRGETPRARRASGSLGSLVHAHRFKIAGAVGVLALAAVALVIMAEGTSIASRNEPAERSLDSNLVLILPFRVVTADTGLAIIGDGLVDLLATKLGGTVGLRAVDPHTTFAALRKWNQSASDLSRDSAVMLASSLGAGRALTGSVVVTLRRIRISADLIDVASGQSRGRAALEGDVDSLTVLLDRLTSQVIGAEIGESAERLATFTSTSPQALREYLRGRAALRRLYFSEAADHFNRALDLDSTFALAAHYLVRAAEYFMPGTAPGYERANRLACTWKDRTSQAERLRLIAFSACPDVVPGTRNIFNPAYLAFLEKATATAPNDADLWARLGDYLFHQGTGLPNWRARAGAALERAVKLNVSYLEALPHLVIMKAGDGDTAAVRRLAERLAIEDTTRAWPVEGIWLPAAVLGDTTELSRLRQSRFADLMTRNADNVVVMVLLSQTIGLRLQDAELGVQVLRDHADSIGTDHALGNAFAQTERFALNAGRPSRLLPVDRHIYRGVLRSDLADVLRVIQALFWDGDRTAAAGKVRSLQALVAMPAKDTVTANSIQPFAHCALGMWFLAHNDTVRAKPHIAHVPDVSAEATRPYSICRYTLTTMLAFARGAPDRLAQLEQLDSLTRTYPGIHWNAGAMHVGRSSQLIVAQLFERMGRPERALAAINHDDRYASGTDILLSSLLREEGRLAAVTGDTARAVRAYRHYLMLRWDPEPPLRPQVEQVRRDLARLGAAPRARQRRR